MTYRKSRVLITINCCCPSDRYIQRTTVLILIQSTAFSYSFPWMKIFELLFKFPSYLFPRTLLILSHHCFRKWLGAKQTYMPQGGITQPWQISICMYLVIWSRESPPLQRTHGAIITSLLRQNDIATSFLRNIDVIIASCFRWDIGPGIN